ncbi:MAG: histidine phosphatase family protein [Oscillospiraceae bacterium]|nr:histidine phosphatase family protein [Oscillospiraceae bacterium]
MTKIFLIRHAEAEGNIFRRAHGHFNGQITNKGHRQIEKLRERFLHEDIDAAYSSDLSRTRVTANAICEPRGLILRTTERLREVNVGAWEDMPWGNIRQNEPVFSELFNDDPARWKTDGSEDYENVKNRMTSCIEEIARNHEGGVVSIFSHGFAIRTFLCVIMGIPSNETMKVPYGDNTAVALLRYEGGTFAIEYSGDNSHLGSENSTLANQTWWRVVQQRRSEDMRYVPYDEKRDAGLLKEGMLEPYPHDARAESNADRAYAVFLEDEPAGFLGYNTERDSEGKIGWIENLYLKPEFSDNDFAIQLIGQAVSDYRKLRREKLRIETQADSPVANLCLKHGFEKAENRDAHCVLEKYIRNW